LVAVFGIVHGKTGGAERGGIGPAEELGKLVGTAADDDEDFGFAVPRRSASRRESGRRLATGLGVGSATTAGAAAEPAAVFASAAFAVERT